MMFRTRFGSWGKALKAAGLRATKFMPPGKKIGTRNKTRKRILDVSGYVLVFEPSHPLSAKNGYVREHRKIAWDAGLLKNPDDEVHHKNEVKHDNRIENFEILPKRIHTSLHFKGKGSKRKSRKKCSFKNCEILTSSKYGFCAYHYRLQWARAKDGRISNIYETPELLPAPTVGRDTPGTGGGMSAGNALTCSSMHLDAVTCSSKITNKTSRQF